MSTWDDLTDDEREASGKGYDGAGSDGADERLSAVEEVRQLGWPADHDEALDLKRRIAVERAEVVPFNEWVQKYAL